MLPFTHGQFLEVFARYNEGIWPAQFAGYLVGAMVCFAVVRQTVAGARAALGGLALMWLWTGVAYHGLFFSAINPAAYAFAALFVVQAILLGVVSARGKVVFSHVNPMRNVIGWGLVVYSMLLYPVIGMAAGGRYPELPMFGIAPCPVTLFTFGVLVLASSRVPWWLLVVPVAWSLVGGSAAALLHVPQDWLLLVSGLCAVPILLQGRRGRRVAVA